MPAGPTGNPNDKVTVRLRVTPAGTAVLEEFNYDTGVWQTSTKDIELIFENFPPYNSTYKTVTTVY